MIDFSRSQYWICHWFSEWNTMKILFLCRILQVLNRCWTTSYSPLSFYHILLFLAIFPKMSLASVRVWCLFFALVFPECSGHWVNVNYSCRPKEILCAQVHQKCKIGPFHTACTGGIPTPLFKQRDPKAGQNYEGLLLNLFYPYAELW